jgi:hypothetical protein
MVCEGEQPVPAKRRITSPLPAARGGEGSPMSERRSKSKDNAPDHARGFRTLPQFGGLSLGHQRCQNNDVASKAAPSRAFCGLVFHTARKLLYHNDGSAASS